MRAPRVGVLIQARSNSSRLPGKIFSPLPNPGWPAQLEHIYRRLSRLSGAAVTAVIVPDNDPFLERWCQARNMVVFCGSEDDVRDRYRRAARFFELDIVVRATGDNPCVDPEIAIDTVRAMLRTDADLFSFTNLPIGTAVEALRADALYSDLIPAADTHCEHVSLHIKHNPDLYQVVHQDHPLMTAYADLPELPRLTVDTAEDLEVARNVYRELGPNFGLAQILNLYRVRPALFSANRHVEQRTFVAGR